MSSHTNTGAQAEDEFEHHWQSQGKAAHLLRFRDNKDIRGLNRGKALAAFKQPSDYLLTHQGVTLYAEVKSSAHPTSFAFGLIAPYQLGSAERIVVAGGRYDFFVRRLHPTEGRWFRLPARVVLSHPRRSLSWTELQPHAVEIPCRII